MALTLAAAGATEGESGTVSMRGAGAMLGSGSIRGKVREGAIGTGTDGVIGTGTGATGRTV